MRLHKRARRHQPEMNMTPMIDVVFQLLIFFMTCFQVSELNRENLELAEQPGIEEQKESSLIINVDQRGEFFVSGQNLPADRLIGLVEGEIQKAGSPERLSVVLRVDRRGTCRAVNELVSDLSRMEVRRVRFAVQVPER